MNGWEQHIENDSSIENLSHTLRVLRAIQSNILILMASFDPIDEQR